jgi:hypothetical protein
LPSSLPDLAAQLAQPFRYWPCQSLAASFFHTPFVPAYRVPTHGSSDRRIQRLADAIAILAERLHRLENALAYWRRFDAGAYFDLHPAQTRALVCFERLGAVVDITLYADFLSPAFRAAERFWGQSYCPAYYAATQSPEDAFTEDFRRHTQPLMQEHIRAAQEEIAAAGNLLFQRGDVTFLAAAAAPDERQRHLRHHPLIATDLFPSFLQLPTLTLSRSFDLL